MRCRVSLSTTLHVGEAGGAPHLQVGDLWDCDVDVVGVVLLAGQVLLHVLQRGGQEEQISIGQQDSLGNIICAAPGVRGSSASCCDTLEPHTQAHPAHLRPHACNTPNHMLAFLSMKLTCFFSCSRARLK
jgi:hypothetical protein